MCWQQLLAVVRDMNICAALQKTPGSTLCGGNRVMLLLLTLHPHYRVQLLCKVDLCKGGNEHSRVLGFCSFFCYCMFQQTRFSNREL